MEQNPLIEFGLPVALMIIMVGMGLGLTFGDFREVIVKPKAMIVGTLAQVALIPLLAFGIANVMGLSPAIAVGLVIIAACPGGTTSNVFTLLARANVALSIVLTVLASLITIATIPLFTNYAIAYYEVEQTGGAVRLPVLKTVITLSVVIIIPVLTGMFVRRRSLRLARRIERHVGRFGLVVLVVLILAIMIGTRDRIGALLLQAGPASVALNLAGIATGLASSKLLGIRRDDGLTIAIEVGIKNGAIGLMVTLTLLKSAQMAVPSAVYGVLMFTFGGLLVVWARKTSPTAVHLEHGQDSG